MPEDIKTCLSLIDESEYYEDDVNYKTVCTMFRMICESHLAQLADFTNADGHDDDDYDDDEGEEEDDEWVMLTALDAEPTPMLEEEDDELVIVDLQ